MVSCVKPILVRYILGKHSQAAYCVHAAIPILGEAGDIAWAPISALLINAMYHSSSPYAGYFGFAEEVRSGSELPT
jgi:hypothetical protein